MKKVLNVGVNSKDIPLPRQYEGFDHVLLDIDPNGSPDIVCDARELMSLPASGFDAVYCSHNLEHYYRHEIKRVLAGFLHVLKDGGFCHVRVPDLGGVMLACIERGLDIEEVLYESPAGPILVHDVIYGYGAKIEESGQDYFAHKTGFTKKSLSRALSRAGFATVFSAVTDLEIRAVAFKGTPDPVACELFDLGRYCSAP